MAKNIIVCADGTGNKGGSTPASNVYKVYKAVDKHFSGEVRDGFLVDEQLVFYDNGVGTAKNKYLRMVGGAFGLGFEDNVRDLYTFLARHYQPGDRVYCFGFSRGASTVRACSGFIHTCGLAKGQGLRNRELDHLVREAFDAYKVYARKPGKAEELKRSARSHGVIDLHFLGIWDTVVALGFPKRTDITGPVSALLNGLFWLAEKGLDRIWPHSFYNYRLTENVKQACQALAIDDERTAFWPFVWREQGREPETVEQVWFAGMHSNVGGGYPRSGMAGVPLYWMMGKAEKWGLKFHDDALGQVFADSHVHGRMYNSRDGFAVFYRYHPREIERLCAGRLQGEIRLHDSVLERLHHRTANYAPGQIPGRFLVVGSDPASGPEAAEQIFHPGQDPQWARIRAEIDAWVLRRKGLYATMLSCSLALLVVSYRLWVLPPPVVARAGIPGHLADILDYILPDFFGGLIEVAVVQHSSLGLSAAGACLVYLGIRSWCRSRTVEACERLRNLILRQEAEETTLVS